MSVIIPCLNEETAVASCVNSARKAIESFGYKAEILVVDNGSTDRTIELAAQAGATVVRCSKQGYGAALSFGVAHSKGNILLFGDGDGSYDFGIAPEFLRPLEKGYDMVLGSRFNSLSPTPKAMPFLHRWLGNPLFTVAINRLYGASFRDVQCGLRSFCRSAFERLSLSADGFEYAVEIVLEAAQQELSVAQIPIIYYATDPVRESKVRTFRDGFRVFGMILRKSPAALKKKLFSPRH